MKKKLGANALQTLEDIVALMEVTHDPDRLDELEDLRVKLTKQISLLVDKSIDEESKEYKKAVAGLQAASATIEQAIKGLEAVAKAIETTAQTVELIAKIAAMA
jgi:hypothetical protein